MPTRERPPARPLEMQEVACALCGDARRVPAFAAPDWFCGLPGEFHVVRCQGCGHLYLNPRPAPGELARLYPDDYAPHHASDDADPRQERGAPRSPWYLSRGARAIPGLRALYYWLRKEDAFVIPAGTAAPGRALELGCAQGRFLAQLRAQGWQVQGVEPIAAPALRAREAGFDVHIGTLESAGFEPASFDAAFAWMVLEHVPDPLLTLRELRRVLRPDGWLVFSVPNAGGWERRVFGRYWYAASLPLHFHHYTPRILRRMLAETGFQLVDIRHQANALNLVGSLGLLGKRWLPRRRWPALLAEYPDDPRMPVELALAPVAKVLAALRCGGRLTVLARAASERAAP